jgi:hypothetical protein
MARFFFQKWMKRSAFATTNAVRARFSFVSRAATCGSGSCGPRCIGQAARGHGMEYVDSFSEQ